MTWNLSMGLGLIWNAEVESETQRKTHRLWNPLLGFFSPAAFHQTQRNFTKPIDKPNAAGLKNPSQVWPYVTYVNMWDQMWHVSPDETSCDQLWFGVTRCDQVCPCVTICDDMCHFVTGFDLLWLGVTRFDQVWKFVTICDKVWPHVSGLTGYDRYDQFWPDVIMCDQLWPYVTGVTEVTRCVVFGVGNMINITIEALQCMQV